MVKNVLIVLLAAACLFFGVDRYGSFLQKDEEISAGEYGGLLSLRELYSAGDYEEKVLPLLREAFVDGKVTRERMQKLDGKLNDLGLRVFERLTRQDTKSRVSRAWTTPGTALRNWERNSAARWTTPCAVWGNPLRR